MTFGLMAKKPVREFVFHRRTLVFESCLCSLFHIPASDHHRRQQVLAQVDATHPKEQARTSSSKPGTAPTFALFVKGRLCLIFLRYLLLLVLLLLWLLINVCIDYTLEDFIMKRNKAKFTKQASGCKELI